MRFEKPALSRFVYLAGLYNILLAIGMAVPAIHRALGINIVDPVLGQIIAGFLLFTVPVQLVGSRDLLTYGWLIYWEGILRWIAALLLIPYGFFGHMGTMAGILGVGDFLIGAVYLFGLPQTLGRSHAALLLAR
jgi:hypothetical protein